MQTRRGGFLTVMALLLALVAIEDVLKPFGRQSPTVPRSLLPPIHPGIVVLGVRHTGAAATILGPLIGAFLIIYVLGVWRMKRYALTAGWIYAAYVVLNLVLFTIRNPPAARNDLVFTIIYAMVAIGITAGTAIGLTGRYAELN